MSDERWSEINTTIGDRRAEFSQTFYRANYAELGVLAGGITVLVGIAMINNPDVTVAVKGAFLISGATLAAKSVWDTFVTVPSRRDEIAQGIGLTRQDVEYWYERDHDDFMW